MRWEDILVTKKSALVAVRLTEEDLESLDRLTAGPWNRGAVLRALLEAFLSKPIEKQRDFLRRRSV